MGQNDRDAERERERARGKEREREREMQAQAPAARGPKPAGPVIPAASSAGIGGSNRARGSGASKRGSTGTARTRSKKDAPPIKFDEDGDIAMLGLPPQQAHEPIKYESEGPSDDYNESDYGKPIDIDRIDISSDSSSPSSDDEMQDAGASTTAARRESRKPDMKPSRRLASNLYPVRLRREEHVDRKIGLNTESSVATAVGAKRGVGEGIVITSDEDEEGMPTTQSRSRSKSKGKARAGKGKGAVIRIKPEPGVAGDAQEVVIPGESDVEPEPESEAEPDPTAPDNDDQDTAQTDNKPILPRHRRTRKPTFQTDEEKQEHDIHARDIIALRNELSQTSVDADGFPLTATNAHNDDEKKDVQDESSRYTNPRENNTYLFQFPPLIPDLVPMASRVKEEKGVKLEEKVKTNEKPAPTPTPAPTTKSTPIKIDPDKPTTTTTKKPHAPQQNDQRPSLAPGHVGKLRMHASGRTTLDWGGTKMELGIGMNVDFLQTAVWVRMKEGGVKGEKDEKEEDGAGTREGEAISMGSVRGKFVVTPDWRDVFA